MLRTAVVGLGWWGRKILETLKTSEKIDIAVGVDLDADGVATLIADHGLRYAPRLEDALGDAAIDAVILATPHALHEDQVLAVVAAGKQVFCEKPLTLTAASTRRVLAACEAAGVVLGIGHERRYERHFEEIERRLRADELGTLLHVEANFSHDKFRAVSADNWRAQAKDSPAAGMTGMGIHLTDAFTNLLGPIEEVHAVTAQRVLDLPTGDIVSVHARFKSGATGYLVAISATPFYGRFTVFGEHGWLEARDTAHVEEAQPSHLVVCDAMGGRQDLTFEAVDAVLANFETWADAVMGKASYRFRTAQILQNIATLEAIVTSAASGRPERVDNG